MIMIFDTKRIVAFAAAFLFLITAITAQGLQHKLGQILVKTDSPVEDIVKEYRHFKGEPTKLYIRKDIAPTMGIYLLQFDYAHIHEGEFLEELRRHPAVITAQYNHLLSQRAVPDDTQFDDQWQYINTGQSGGVVGADIEADLAWDIATGGVTALGDTIVAAVIDDGIDWQHQDFGDNIWVNYAEIPNDGIDNDNNGYIDDRRGWNAYAGNDNITGGWHGTPVAGIVGAQGNNANGVTGVNWDVKLMIIQGGGDEADALAAYAYCYTMRQMYNQSGGAEGAFVVSTNASWGIDFGQPADAPLWCDFYNTLGEEGVMSCGATINGNVNVDEQGDLPTGCDSDYLITVTNMNDDDVKVTGAGYGTVTIDLGAFGDGTWTVAAGNNYGGFGGTSGATPHVAGTVALMYSVPCPSFAAFAKADPAAAALLTKQYILDGVTPNASLQGITVTGGKLNMYNALNAIVENCSADGCFTPYSLGVDNLLDTSVDLLYSVGAQTDMVDLQYRIIGAADWTDIPNAGEAPYNLSGLVPCTEYEFRARASCTGVTTDWSTPRAFKTDGCCEPPAGITANVVDDNTVSLEWGSVLIADGYEIQYRETGAPDWETIMTTATTYTLGDLMACAEYELRIRTQCNTGGDSEYSETILFNTTGCGQCVEGDYCESNAVDATFEWIASVQINTLSSFTDSDGGYANFTGMSTDLEMGQSYDITLVPGFMGNTYSEYFLVWIDYNQDGVFDPATETAFDPGDTTEGSITGTVTIPTNLPNGPARMRVSMAFLDPVGPCEQDFDYGEVEDYCVNIVGGIVPGCDTPQNVAVGVLTTTTADISWDAVASATAYELRYREVGAATWQMESTTDNNLTLSGLSDCVQHEFQVRGICVTPSEYSDNQNFTTECEVSTHAPEGLDFQIQPNPNTGLFQVALPESGFALEVFDARGRLLHRGEYAASQARVDLSDQAAGLYFVRILQDGREGIRKVVKQ